MFFYQKSGARFKCVLQRYVAYIETFFLRTATANTFQVLLQTCNFDKLSLKRIYILYTQSYILRAQRKSSYLEGIYNVWCVHLLMQQFNLVLCKNYNMAKFLTQSRITCMGKSILHIFAGPDLRYGQWGHGPPRIGSLPATKNTTFYFNRF